MTKEEAIEHINKLVNDGETICLNMWTLDDVYTAARILGRSKPHPDEADNILQSLEENFDANDGINWYTIGEYLPE